jgi:hypothetical protein
MAQPIVLRFKSDTESARRAVMALGTTVATSMASVSAAAIAAHQSTGVSIGGIAATALKAAASLTAMQYAAIAAFAAFTAAAAAGAAELERFEKIAKKAADANVGTTFFQAFVDGARALRLETKQLENPGAIGDGAAGSDYCPVLCFTKVRVAQPTIGYPIIVNSIEYRVRLIPVSGTSFTVASGLVLPVSVYTGSVMAYGYYPARESYVSDYTQVKAGTYNVSIEWRWSNDTGNALADNAIGIRLGADIIIDTRRR